MALDPAASIAACDMATLADEVFRPWAETLPAAIEAGWPLPAAPDRGRGLSAAVSGWFGHVVDGLRNVFRG